MMKTLNNQDSEWRAAREKEWTELENEVLIPQKVGPSSLTTRRLIFLGDVVDPGDPIVDFIDEDITPKEFFYLTPYHSVDNWNWFVREGWNTWAVEDAVSKADVVFTLILMCVESSPVWRRSGLTKKQVTILFHHLAGTSYTPGPLSFDGESVPNPLFPEMASRLLAANVNSVLSGRSDADNFWVLKYDFFIDSVRHVNEAVFEPRSKPIDLEEQRAKVAWASLLKTLSDMEGAFARTKGDDKLCALWRESPFDIFRDSEQICTLAAQVDKDLAGKLPPSLGLLRSWVATPGSDVTQLKFYSQDTHAEHGYLWDSAKPSTLSIKRHGEPSKRTSIQRSQASLESAVVDHAVEKHVCAELEKFRALAIDGGMAGYDTPLDSFAAYTNWKGAGSAAARNAAALRFNALYGLREEFESTIIAAYVEELFPDRLGSIQFDVFGSYAPGDINREFGNAWRLLCTLAHGHLTMKGVRVRKKIDSWGDYEVAVSVTTDTEKHVFEYVLDSDWMDFKIMSDAAEFAASKSLPWRFWWDDGDSTKAVMYLPTSFEQVLDSG